MNENMGKEVVSFLSELKLALFVPTVATAEQ